MRIKNSYTNKNPIGGVAHYDATNEELLPCVDATMAKFVKDKLAVGKRIN